MAHVFSKTGGFGFCVTIVTQSPVLVSDETQIGQFLVATVTPEALRMPVGVHCFNNSANDEFTFSFEKRSRITVSELQDSSLLA